MTAGPASRSGYEKRDTNLACGRTRREEERPFRHRSSRQRLYPVLSPPARRGAVPTSHLYLTLPGAEWPSRCRGYLGRWQVDENASVQQGTIGHSEGKDKQMTKSTVKEKTKFSGTYAIHQQARVLQPESYLQQTGKRYSSDSDNEGELSVAISFDGEVEQQGIEIGSCVLDARL